MINRTLAVLLSLTQKWRPLRLNEWSELFSFALEGVLNVPFAAVMAAVSSAVNCRKAGLAFQAVSLTKTAGCLLPCPSWQ